jgi:hypothetical protein
MIEIIKLVRDIMIILAMAHLTVGYWVLMDAEFVGQWQANVDITYDSIMTEYYADCDCGVEQ